MAAMLELKIDLSKIDKSKIFVGKKGKYYTLTVAINDDTNDWGQNVSAFDAQSKEQQDAKEAKNYIANGKVFWLKDGIKVADKKEADTPQQAPAPEETDDLPF